MFSAGFDKLKSMVVPSPVKLSTLLSVISKVGKLFANRLPQKTSDADGAVENTMTLLKSIPYPVAGLALSCPCWITPLIETWSCADLWSLASVPFS